MKLIAGGDPIDYPNMSYLCDDAATYSAAV